MRVLLWQFECIFSGKTSKSGSTPGTLANAAASSFKLIQFFFIALLHLSSPLKISPNKPILPPDSNYYENYKFISANLIYSGVRLRITKAPNWYFSWHSDRFLNCCCNLPLLTHICHIWELSNKILYDSVPIGVSKIWRVKSEKSRFTW